MSKKIMIYSRKSAYTGKGDSIENQIELCRDYASRQFGEGCAFFVYEDEGFSGKNTARPEFQRMLRDMRGGQFDVLICYRLDRISRSVSDFSSVLEELALHNVDFVSVREHFDTSTPIGRAMIHIASVFAELERETIAERIRDNKYKLYRLGYWQGGFAPVGLKTVKVEGRDEDGRKRTHYQLAVDTETEAHAKMLFERFLELGSISKLENRLLREPVLTVQGKEYSQAVLRQILKNPAYAINDPCVYDYLSAAGCDLANSREEYDGQRGLVAYGKTQTVNSKISKRTRADFTNWIVAISPHKGLIPGDQWVTVQERITANGKKRPRLGTSNVSLLSGLIRCGKCGAPMIIKGNGKLSDGTPTFSYKCGRKDRSSGELCGIPNINGPKFDYIIVETLKSLFSDTGAISETIGEMFQKLQVERTSREKQIHTYRARIAENQKRLTNLALKLADCLDAGLEAPIYDAMKKLRDEVRRDETQLEILMQNESADTMEEYSLEAVRAEMSGFCSGFDQKGLSEQRKTLQTIIKSIVWHGDDFILELFNGKVHRNAFPLTECSTTTSPSAPSPCNFTNNTCIRNPIR